MKASFEGADPEAAESDPADAAQQGGLPELDMRIESMASSAVLMNRDQDPNAPMES